jgi:xanthine dehydrogenase YagR molybdenum-binding subunit
VDKIVALQEVGKPVNRNTIENQITGACIEGIGYAMFEDRILNAATGAMNNANLEMYKCPGAVDIPEIIPVIWRSDPDSPVNAVGEPPSVPIAGAIGCAIFNAIGVPVRKMPMTPRRVLAALGGQKGAVA